MEPPPVVHAFVVADGLHRDNQTGKWFVLGTRLVIVVPSVPHEQATLGVYFVLSDGRGEAKLSIRVIDVNEERDAVAVESITVTFSDPLEVREQGLILMDLSFPEAGDYRVQLLVDDQVVHERRLFLVSLGLPGQP